MRGAHGTVGSPATNLRDEGFFMSGHAGAPRVTALRTFVGRGVRPALLAALLGAALQAQPQPPTFSAGNRTVAVYATVTDAG